MSKKEYFYNKQLQKYFNKHFRQYEQTVEWFNNPDVNSWKFYIPDICKIIILICQDNGEVIEKNLVM